MANHGYITSKKFFSKEKIYNALCEINKNRFNNLLFIEQTDWCDKGSWYIGHSNKDTQNSIGFNIWLTSARKLEHRHCGHSWGSYLEVVVSEEIGLKFNGTMADDAFAEKWQPEPSKYSSFKVWLDLLYGHAKDSNTDMYNRVIELNLSMCPEEFLDM